MNLLVLILIYIFSSIYACLEGVREAYYFHYRIDNEDNGENLHPLFWSQRFIVLLLVFLFTFLLKDLLSSSLISISILLHFSFWHNGFQYIYRNKLNPNIYKNGFKEQSTTTNAKISLNFINRLFLFIASCIIFVALCLMID